MLLPLLASALIASSPPPDALATPEPAPAPSAAPGSPPPARTPASIDSLLKSQDLSTDEDSAPSGAAPGPVPYSEVDARAYDTALKNAAAAARSASGPLDGGWVLASSDGHRMYRFQFQDRGYGLSQAEGAWRDLDGGARLKGSGFINQINFANDGLILRFYEGGADDEVIVTVKAAKTGGWSGQLLRHGAFTQVVFTRD
jgi:hypothetical protein